MENSIVVPSFEGKEIRKIWHEEQWYFSIIDVIEFLTESPSPIKYWVKLKSIEFKTSPFWEQLKMTTKDGKSGFTECANTEGVFRVLKCIPSPKAEQFKRWLVEMKEQSA